MNPDIQMVAASKNVLPKEIVKPCFLQSAIQNLCAFDELTSNVDIRELHVVGIAGDDHPFDHLMRIFVDDLFVLERAGLGLVRIADEKDRLAAFPIYKRPFQAARETGSTAPSQAGKPHLFAKLFGAA